MLGEPLYSPPNGENIPEMEENIELLFVLDAGVCNEACCKGLEDVPAVALATFIAIAKFVPVA